MWKTLRNLVLAGLLLAGTLKLLAWYEAGQDAQRLGALLGPTLQLSYGGISAGLDGSVALSDVGLTVKGAPGGNYRADRVVVETPNVLWLLKHALLGEDTWPGHFGVTVQGLKFPPALRPDPHWFDAATLVPFETAGCAAAQFSAADLRRMDVTGADVAPTLHGEFRYEQDTKELDASLVLSAPETANVTLSADVSPFDGAALRSIAALQRLHVARLGFDYADSGFLRKRNQFCAQRASVAATQFVEQHLAAVQAQLQQHGVEPSAEVLKLYRRLIENGGRGSVLSLPTAGFTVATFSAGAREDLLRQLNATARYADTPPIMLRLSFPAPPESETAVAETPAAAAPPAATAPTTATPPTTAAPPPVVAIAPAPVPSTAAAPSKPPTPTPPSTPPPAATPPPPVVATAKPAATLPPTAPPPTSATAPPTNSVVSTATPPTPSATAPTTPNATNKPSAVLARPATSGNGLEEFDRAAAKLAPPPPPPTAPTASAGPKRDGAAGTDVAPSSAPPPTSGNSTLALVWKPTFERLPPSGPERHDFDVIEFAGLPAQTGHYVRLVTQAGKKVEGYVVSADENQVELRVNQGGGSVHFVMQKTDVQQVLVARTGAPPA